ncbi:class F sortase [Candidatus Nomurabacteria bacterium]|nr:class F sortase [Candidatus Nomurabacteria bacterium]
MKTNKKYLVTAIIILAFLVFAIILSNAIFYAPSDEIPLPLASVSVTGKIPETSSSSIKTAEKISEGYPAVLSIPAIKVRAKVEQVGITSKGNMATPRIFRNVGWYKYGAIPGDLGSAVIAGHVDNGLGLGAVFSRLSELKQGDDIYITTDENKTLHFIIAGSEVYDFNAKAPEIFRGKDGKILRLITCTGTWLKEYRTRDKRLVVSAVLVE